MFTLYLLGVGDCAAGAPAGDEGGVEVSLDHGQVVARPQLGLQEEGGAHAAQLAVRDDGNAISQDVCLIHVVGGQQDGSAYMEFTNVRCYCIYWLLLECYCYVVMFCYVNVIVCGVSSGPSTECFMIPSVIFLS